MGALEIVGGDQPDTAPAKTQGKGLGRRLLESTVNSLPFAGMALGGTAGGIAGAPVGGVGALPGAVGGAGFGAMGGEAAKQLASRALGMEAPQTGPEAANQIAGQGIMGAGTELLPPMLTNVAKGVGGAMMRAAGKMSPELARTALEERIPVSRAGVSKILARLGELGNSAQRMVGMATRRGVRFDPNSDVIQPALAKIMPDVKAGDDPSGNTDKLLDMARTWLEGRFKPTGPGTAALPDKITPVELMRAKQASDAVAEQIHAAVGRKEVVDFDPLRQKFNKAIADQVRQLFSGIPELKAITARESRLIALKDAIRPIAEKDIGFGGRLARPTLTGLAGAGIGAAAPGTEQERITRGGAGAVAGALLGGPAGISNTALAFQGPSSPFAQMLLSQNPRLMALFAQHLGQPTQ